MKAIRVHRTGPPEVLQLEEAPPPVPQEGQVLVRVRAAGVNPVDTYVRAGLFGYRPQTPYTPGADAAGVVEAVGRGVRGVAVGQRVFGGRSVSGAYAELAVFDEPCVAPLPERVSFAQGACLGIPFATAYWALHRKAKAQPGETVLVHGASGGVGTAAVQLARAVGLSVIGTAGSPKGQALVRELGAAHTLDHRDPRHHEQVLALTGGQGVPVILEMLADRNLGQDLALLARFGRVVVIGSRGTVEIDPREAMAREATILGMRLGHLAREEAQAVYAELARGLAEGALTPVVGRELPLARAAEAHEAVMRPPAYGNIVLIP